MSLAHLYTDSVAIERSTEVVNVTGSITRSWVTLASTVSCEIQPVRQNFELTDKGFIKSATHRGFFELNTTIRRGDRVQMSTIYPPQLFDVVAVKEIRFHHLECDLLEVNEADSSASGGSS